MLQRWEKLAEDGRHMVLWFDSFFNAVQFVGNSKNIDLCAQKVIGTLDHWCAALNCTILAPFHPSRAGDDRGDTGYSAAFQDTIREVLSIGEKKRKVKDGRPNDYEGTGEYRLRIMKWNGGQQGKDITFTYEDGQLVTYEDAAERGAMISVQAAVAIIEEFTYKGDEGVLARLRDPGLPDGERDGIERGFTARIRRDGAGWKIGGGDGAIKLTSGHHLIDRFREITGNGRAGCAEFLSALTAAERAGLLRYAERDPTIKSTKRPRPATALVGANQVALMTTMRVAASSSDPARGEATTGYMEGR